MKLLNQKNLLYQAVSSAEGPYWVFPFLVEKLRDDVFSRPICYNGKDTGSLYKKEVAFVMRSIFEYANVQEIPKIVKISVSRGIGEAVKESKLLNSYLQELSLITGQYPITTKASKSIAGFKIRQGMKIGGLVTLRRKRMHTFLTKLIHIILPRIRDFQGLSPYSFDGCGNFAVGVPEQFVFPEILYDDVIRIQGFNISILTTAETDLEALVLLRAIGLPFMKRV
jgi:large subunit ribosomal protein L5